MLNPMQIIQLMQSGRNPQMLMQQIMQQNPQMQQIMQNVDFNNKNSVQQMCRNICIQKGLDFDTMIAQFRQNGGKLN